MDVSDPALQPRGQQRRGRARTGCQTLLDWTGYLSSPRAPAITVDLAVAGPVHEYS